MRVPYFSPVLGVVVGYGFGRGTGAAAEVVGSALGGLPAPAGPLAAGAASGAVGGMFGVLGSPAGAIGGALGGSIGGAVAAALAAVNSDCREDGESNECEGGDLEMQIIRIIGYIFGAYLFLFSIAALILGVYVAEVSTTQFFLLTAWIVPILVIREWLSSNITYSEKSVSVGFKTVKWDDITLSLIHI